MIYGSIRGNNEMWKIRMYHELNQLIGGRDIVKFTLNEIMSIKHFEMRYVVIYRNSVPTFPDDKATLAVDISTPEATEKVQTSINDLSSWTKQ